MTSLYLAIIGNSSSFPELIKFMHDEGILVRIQFYPTISGTDVLEQPYDAIFIDNSSKYDSLFTEYTASSFFKEGGKEKIKVSTENTLVIGFPNTKDYPVITGNDEDTYHRLSFIMPYIKSRISRRGN